MHYDLTLKDLFSALPQRLFRHVFGAEAVEIGSLELSATLSKPDLFGRLANGEYCHGELQSTGEPGLGWRMLGYRWFFGERWGIKDVRQVVFALRRSVTVPARVKNRGLRLWYQVVYFEDIEASLLAGGDAPEEQVLSVLCRGGTDPANVRRVLLRCLECPRDRRDVLIGHLQVLSGLRPGLDQTIQEELQKTPVTIDLLENVMFREAYERAVAKGQLEGIEKGFERGVEKGIEQGIEKGIERGIEQGIKRERRALFVRLLERRFGPLAEPHRDRISQASADDLVRWTDRLLDAPSIEAVFE